MGGAVENNLFEVIAKALPDGVEIGSDSITINSTSYDLDKSTVVLSVKNPFNPAKVIGVIFGAGEQGRQGGKGGEGGAGKDWKKDTPSNWEELPHLQRGWHGREGALRGGEAPLLPVSVSSKDLILERWEG